MLTPQIESTSTLSRNHTEVFKKLVNGPVYIATRSQKAAVILSVSDYESLITDQQELRRLRRMQRAEQAAAEMDAGHYTSFTPDQILAMGE
jgi:PHD/YefM family antitoxin component YafN of YafNO toxin-antitoxin module